MSNFTFNIKGLLRDMRLAESKALWPLFEAVVNAIQAIEDSPNRENGKITVYVHRENTRLAAGEMAKVSSEKIEAFSIEDNGVGLDTQNYESFLSAYSTHKVQKGCKGIGRFLWLKAFDHVEISSTFCENGQYYQRQFVFSPEGNNPEDNVQPCDETKTGTSVKLVDFQGKYKMHSPVELDVIATKLIEHCLLFFICGNCPQITLMDGVNESINLNAKDFSESFKYRAIFEDQTLVESPQFSVVELADGSTRPITKSERENPNLLPKGSRVFTSLDLSSSGRTESCVFDYEYNGKKYSPTQGKSWKTNLEGMKRLEKAGRLYATANALRYRLYHEDFPVKGITNLWNDSVGVSGKIYVVQTDTKPIQRCMLMTTDPGDLVLDITCGSGTTAYVAEQWGRRWITCDTSRVAITLAKQRLMTATFDYYRLAHETQGVSSGFVYKTVPHVTIKSIAQNEPASREVLYDQPEIDKSKVRITGPFTVEALPAPVVKPLDDISEADEDISAKQTDWRDQLLATGIMGRGGSRLEFTRVEPLSGTKFLQAEAETKEANPRRAVICFAGETKPLDSRMVAMALDEAEMLRPAPKLIIFAAFQFDPEAAKTIDEMNWPGVTLLKAQMNTDLMTGDLKKKISKDQSFWLVGQPDVELIRDGRSKTKFKVKVHGFDYYDVKKGTVESGSTSRIAMWMLDTDYDGMCIEPKQVFFPMGGKKDGWNKLAKTLKSEIDLDLIEKYAGNESLWFRAEPNTRIAVKIIDDRGIESLKVIRIGDE